MLESDIFSLNFSRNPVWFGHFVLCLGFPHLENEDAKNSNFIRLLGLNKITGALLMHVIKYLVGGTLVFDVIPL